MRILEVLVETAFLRKTRTALTQSLILVASPGVAGPESVPGPVPVLES